MDEVEILIGDLKAVRKIVGLVSQMKLANDCEMTILNLMIESDKMLEKLVPSTRGNTKYLEEDQKKLEKSKSEAKEISEMEISTRNDIKRLEKTIEDKIKQLGLASQIEGLLRSFL